MYFFWEYGNRDNKGMRLMRWGIMDILKVQGGLEYRDLHQFNLDIVAKQDWRILQQPNALALKIMKARYFRDS